MTLLFDTFLFYSLSGFAVGIIAGLLGIGGGMLIIPCLLYLAPLLHLPGLPIHQISGVAVSQSLASSLMSAWVHTKQNNLDWAVALRLGAGALVGSYLGGYSTQWIPEPVFYLLLMSVLFGVLILTFIQPKKPPSESTASDNSSRLPPLLSFPSLLFTAISILIGYIAGVLGIGGAMFMIPIMYSVLGLSPARAIGTGSGIVILTASLAFIGKWQTDLIPLQFALPVTIGAILGAPIGAKLTPKTHPTVLKALLTLILISTLTRLLLEQIGNNWIFK